MIKTIKSYSDAVSKVYELISKLHTDRIGSRSTITRIDGKKRKGYRVFVTRLSDGMNRTCFISD